MVIFRNLFLIGIVFSLLGCAKKETKFFELKGLRFEIGADQSTNGQIAEYFVVANSPDNLDELAERINLFNSKTINVQEIERKGLSFYTRFFYSESTNLSKNYKEEDAYFSNTIEDHIDDLIAVVEYKDETGWRFKLKVSNEPDKWKEYSFL